jgi:hypothetical protein
MRTPRSGPANPFLPSVLARGAHFADREEEVARIQRTYGSPGARLVVFGERRLGKSSALWRAAELARKQKTRVAIATFATATDSADAAKRLLLAVREQLGRDWRASLERMVGRLQGSIVLMPGSSPAMPPSVHLSLGLREEEPEASLIPEALGSIHQEIEARDLHLAIAIDEFQRMHAWGGEDAEWALKAALETHPRTSYVLAGSQKGLIEAMVTTRGRALWKQTDVLPFGPIEAGEMAGWIQSRASRTGADFSLAACDRVVELAGHRTRDIVQLAREVWFEAQRIPRIEPAHVDAAFDQQVRVQEALYATQWRGLSTTAQRILRALVQEPGIQLTSADALTRYRLGAKSTVSSTVQRLQESEVLTPGERDGHAFDDPYFRRWVETRVIEPAI